MAKPSSPIQVINLNGDTNPMDGREQDVSQQGNTLALLVTKVNFPHCFLGQHNSFNAKEVVRPHYLTIGYQITIYRVMPRQDY